MSSHLQIGNITSGYRPIKNGLEYNKYFPKPDERDRVIIEDGEVEQTVDLMKRVVWKYLDDTKQIASVLKGSTNDQTCDNIWNFLFHHIQYRLDKKGVEQLRRPARSWYERKEGIDCDCFSIFISSILTNLGIKHSFRITKYSKDVYQHVYVIVPVGNHTHIIDPVLSQANYEKPYTEKKDFSMSLDGINVAVLSGTVEQDLYDVVMATDLEGLGLGSMDEQQEMDAIYRHLIATRNTVASNPEMISLVDDPQAFLKMLDYAIEHWNTPNRDKALAILAQNEDKLNLQHGISGLEEELDDDEELLGRLFKRRKNKGSRKGFFNNIRKAVKKKGGILRKIGKALIRFNPVSIAARNGFLIAMKLNIKKIASRLKWAYATKEQARKKGISEDKWNKAKKGLEQVEKLFADKLQGKRRALKKAILNGRAGKLDGTLGDLSDIELLGEPFTAVGAATVVTSAIPIIKKVINALKKVGLFSKKESDKVEVSAEDIQSMAKSAPQVSSESNMAPDDVTDFEMDESNYPTRSTNAKPPNKAVNFIKKNPMVAVGGLAAIGGVGYLLLGGKKKKNGNLSGTTKRKTAARKPARKKTTSKSSVKSITLS